MILILKPIETSYLFLKSGCIVVNIIMELKDSITRTIIILKRALKSTKAPQEMMMRILNNVMAYFAKNHFFL